MDTKIEQQTKRIPIEMSFMRGKTKNSALKPKPRSLLEMTREEFKERLNQHKSRSDTPLH